MDTVHCMDIVQQILCIAQCATELMRLNYNIGRVDIDDQAEITFPMASAHQEYLFYFRAFFRTNESFTCDEYIFHMNVFLKPCSKISFCAEIPFPRVVDIFCPRIYVTVVPITLKII